MCSRPWPAPAKLNLFLHVLGRREDGYHRLQSVFQFLDRCDQIEIAVREDGVIRRNGELEGVPEERDLSVRAAQLLQRYAGTGQGAELRLHKRLPMGGGLGGGSSDAATVLVALNHLWELGLTEEVLAALALQLGADVPVFVRGEASWAEGVGEELTPVALPEPWFLVLCPAVTVSTAEVFSAPELTRNTHPITISDFLAGRARNDCESLVRQRYPAVDQALQRLSEFGAARMTGTGACVFVAFDSEARAKAARERLPPSWTAFVARGCNRSPLLDRLQYAKSQRRAGRPNDATDHGA